MTSNIQTILSSKLRFDNHPKLWLRIKVNEIKMIKERGYDVENEEEKYKDMSPEEFENYTEDNNLDFTYRHHVTGRKIYVHYIRTPGTRDVGRDAIKYFTGQLSLIHI